MVMMMMTSLEMGSLSFNQQINHGIMGDHHGHDHHSSLPYSGDISSPESDLTDDGSISSGCSSPASPAKVGNGALGDMSSLLQQLPMKRGLSKYFNGKSQSYSSLSNVTCLEDLAKPENPYNKKLKSCKSYMCFSEDQKSPPNVLKSSSSSKLISKKSSSRGSCSSSMASSKRNGSSGFIGNNNGMNMKPPTHPTPLRSSSTSSFNNCTPLFA